jgi:hypothetical protein
MTDLTEGLLAPKIWALARILAKAPVLLGLAAKKHRQAPVRVLTRLRGLEGVTLRNPLEINVATSKVGTTIL